MVRIVVGGTGGGVGERDVANESERALLIEIEKSLGIEDPIGGNIGEEDVGAGQRVSDRLIAFGLDIVLDGIEVGCDCFLEPASF